MDTTILRKAQILVLLSMFSISLAHAIVWDIEREELVARRLSNEIDFGEVVWLKSVFGKSSPAVFTSAGVYANPTAILMLHGMGKHADSPIVISPLRRLFLTGHWSTLSIQLPVLSPGRPPSDYGKTLKEAERRIDAAINYLAEKNYQHVVILGQGFGAATALHKLKSRKNEHVKGVILISVTARKFLDEEINIIDLLENNILPTLDIYAENDRITILKNADDRRLAASKNGQNQYTQLVIADTDNYYTNRETELFDLINDWLINQQ